MDSLKQEIVEKLPKVELHCHLDGSVSRKTIRKIAEAQDYPLPSSESELRNLVQAGEDCQSLLEYIGKFDTVLDCLQVEEAITEAAYDLIGDVKAENVAYIEVRFAPMLSTHKGLSADQVVQAALTGFKKGEADFGVKSRGILCMMRHHDDQRNREVVELTKEYLGQGIVGIDLAGDEASYPAGNYKELVKLANDYDLPITLHAGECGCAGNVRESVDMGATRIGHGIALKDDPEILAYCVEQGITVEICPNSNLQTKTVTEWSDYPYLKLKEAGLNISLNTDNRTITDTNLTKEFMTLDNLYQIGYEGMQELTENGIKASFTEESMKKELLAFVRKEYQEVSRNA
ncbi:adenosine deaminase [Carnobacterium gallinarum]|uniref:adenosine deaminase n=1 Tax=Carnobacterium gallinarum TaxID=2749 RepID=UPI000557FA9D|nr:adenosine deaminase [Carnobacterium gallinarum]